MELAQFTDVESKQLAKVLQKGRGGAGIRDPRPPS